MREGQCTTDQETKANHQIRSKMNMQNPVGSLLLAFDKGRSWPFRLGRELWQAWDDQAIGLGVDRSTLVRAAIVHELISLGYVDGRGVDVRWTEQQKPTPIDLSAVTPRAKEVRIPAPLVEVMKAAAADSGTSFHGWFCRLSRERFGKNYVAPDHRKVA
jgi:hypothetical protein